jgi:hypothetical protein
MQVEKTSQYDFLSIEITKELHYFLVYFRLWLTCFIIRHVLNYVDSFTVATMTWLTVTK